MVQSSKVCESLSVSHTKSDEKTNAGLCVQVQWWTDGKQFKASGFLMVSTSTYVLLKDLDLSKPQIKRIPVSSTTVVTTLVH
jgi:hypothetical protein